MDKLILRIDRVMFMHLGDSLTRDTNIAVLLENMYIRFAVQRIKELDNMAYLRRR
jgi:hypothetical protein